MYMRSAIKYRAIIEMSEGIQTALYHGTTHAVIQQYCCPNQYKISFNYLHCDVLQYYVATEMEIFGCAIELHVPTNALGGVPKPSQLQMGTDVYAFPSAHKIDAESSEENGFEINFSLSSKPPPNSEDLLQFCKHPGCWGSRYGTLSDAVSKCVQQTSIVPLLSVNKFTGLSLTGTVQCQRPYTKQQRAE
ncbi:hypothetical protein T265_01784 [Opisthorchis viverrini]|uniref:Uncharacterized protein n=1 Tax=Opisthorchis viverrini TaxID=6198 RepID=A0A075AIT1_OPIVI|nr:hypothetical protein T265_01784 [Opisthorchis viverrini]KER32174.1 hypothetical protein T265_01784 [Opisthorchis viverrini]